MPVETCPAAGDASSAATMGDAGAPAP